MEHSSVTPLQDGHAFTYMSARATVGLVGLGHRSHVHATRLDEAGCRVVGTDADEDARERFESTFGTRTYASPGEMLAEDHDAVVVTTPTKFHEQPAIDALKRGYDTLVEKPLAHTVESAERIVDAATASDAACFVGFHHRCAETTKVLAQRVEDGYFGTLSHVEARYIRRRGIPGRGTWFTSKEIAGGGALIDIGVHAIDLTLFLLGFPELEEVTAVTRTEFGNQADYTYLNMFGRDGESDMFTVEDSATATIRFDTGQTMSLEVAWAANLPDKHQYLLRGTDAGARLTHPDLQDNQLECYETRDVGAPHFVDRTVVTDGEDATTNALLQFLRFLETGDSGRLATAEEALATQRVVDAIYDASDRSTPPGERRLS
jgi:predicted dehydrogenase